ncbi:MAG: peptide chain release factor N(5)-glutamine methyltransferase [Clostridia bacterium]|nr:peptide chain release factor N(5)-glutamine methyltransferase [Clostridia bacterium]
MKKNKSVKCTKIGGQAVIEGVMMRGESSMATAVRDERGEILIEAKRIKSSAKKCGFLKMPIIRGVVAFLNSLIGGTKCLMRSATVYGEEESSEFDNWLSKKTGIDAIKIAMFLGVFLGVLLSVFLFFFLPQWIADLFTFIEKNSLLYFLIEGLVRIVIFISYILLTSLLPDIKRTYMYHGAEHKTISCYECGMELNVENVKKCSRVHDRCGTTFTFLVMVISILVFAIITQLLLNLGIDLEFAGLGRLWRFLSKIATLPIVAGVSYEILKLLSKTQSKWVYIFKFPGLLLQRITTREPKNDMIEVAITAFNKVLEMDADSSIPECEFGVFGTAKTLLEKVKKILSSSVIDDADAEWIVALTLNVKRSELLDKTVAVTKEQSNEAIKIAKKRAEGIPLSYILGETEFYGFKIKVDNNVLIPRPETEELCMHAIKEITSESIVLDMCTGSGAIAIAVNKLTGSNVTAVDISNSALNVAKNNAELNKANVTFINSNLFDAVEGKFDFILSNPPYVKTSDLANLSEEVKKEPTLTLDGGEDGLDFYRVLAEKSHEYLNENGVIYMEIGINQDNDVISLFKNDNYKNVCAITDINNVKRIIRAVKNDI